MTRILAAASPGEVRIAVMDGDQLLDFGIDRPGAPDGIGDRHIGRIAARVPAMAGAFVTLAGAEGFLPDSAGAAGLPEGTVVAVTITRSAQGGKGPRLAAISLAAASQAATSQAGAEGPPRLLQRGPAALERAAALHRTATVLIDDSALFAAMRQALGDRARLVPRAFDDALEADVEALGHPACSLPGGMRATIVPTPTLTAIDIDAAAGTLKPVTQLEANRGAIPALAHQIRLRNLGGAILIDFAGMAVRKRAVLAPILEDALRADPARPRLIGFTGLGLAEILRPRIHPPLHERLAGPHAHGLEALRHIARRSVAAPASRLTLKAAPAIVSALQADPFALPDLARRTTHPLILTSDPSLGPNAWIIEDAPRA